MSEFFEGVNATYYFPPEVRADFGGSKWNIFKGVQYATLQDGTIIKSNEEGMFDGNLTRQQIKYIADNYSKNKQLPFYIIIKNGITDKAGWYIKYRPDAVLNTPHIKDDKNQKHCWVFIL
jgi:hypothetical protein